MDESVTVTTAKQTFALRAWFPGQFVFDLWPHRALIFQFAQRMVQSRYRSSYLGFLWAILTPLILLCVYTFVFSVVFQARWGTSVQNERLDFALNLFAGLIVYNFFAEVASAAPAVIIAHSNLVKKVVFPLEIIPVAQVFAAFVNFLIGVVLLLLASLMLNNQVPWTTTLIPFILLPLALFTLAVAWFLSALGVFLRDIGHTVAVVLQVLMFATPIFYPVEAVPERFRLLIHANPLTAIVDWFRSAFLQCQKPNWSVWVAMTFAFALSAHLAYLFFCKCRRAFADVI